MRILIVFYSRTKTTKKVAEALQKRLNCDIEEIIDTKNRSGPVGWVASSRDAIRKTLAKIKTVKHDPGSYDLVIIGTPVWVGTMSAPIRAYLRDHKHQLKNVALFSTQGADRRQKVFNDMVEFIDIKPRAKLYFTTEEVIKDGFEKKIDKFIKNLI